jgi:hypothetical protein
VCNRKVGLVSSVRNSLFNIFVSCLSSRFQHLSAFLVFKIRRTRRVSDREEEKIRILANVLSMKSQIADVKWSFL